MKKSVSLLLCIIFLFSAFTVCINAADNDSSGLYPIEIKSVEYSDDNYNFKIEKAEQSSDYLTVKKAKNVLQKSSGNPLPSSFDNRNFNWNPPVRDQGNTGCCWAFAAINALETYAIAKGYETPYSVNFSPSHLAWYTFTLPSNTDDPLYGEGWNSADPYNVGGNWLIAASTLSEWNGIATLDDFPFYPYDADSMRNFPESGRYNCGSGYVIDSVVELTAGAEMKNWIMQNGSCTIGIYYDIQYENRTTGAYYCNSPITTNHNISVIGWDDNYSAGNFNINPGVDGAWLIKDSWGTRAHKGGYYWLSYADASIDYIAGFTLKKAEDCYRSYSYTGCGYVLRFEIPNAVSLCNVFKSTGYEKITSVSIYIDDPNTTVRFKITKNLPAGFKDPETGTTVFDYTITYPNKGYHTVYLPEEISLAPNEEYAVIASLSSDSVLTIPVDKPVDGAENISMTYKYGQSYIYVPADSQPKWWEASNRTLGNFWVQAQTKCIHTVNENELPQMENPTCSKPGGEYRLCTQCGKKMKISVLPPTGLHNFSQWSSYTRQNNTMVSTRYCLDCGAYETHSYQIAPNNVITFDVLLKMIFEKILYFIIPKNLR